VAARAESRWRCAVAVAAMVVAATGCGRRGVELVPATGVVTVGGEPVADLEVQFMPDAAEGNAAPTSYGITGADGRFELRVRDGRVGAVPGRHFVVVTDVNEERPAQGQPLTRPPRVAARYATAAGGLTAEVGRSGAPIEIAIPAVGRSR